MLLERDKRERKASTEQSAAPTQGGEDPQVTGAITEIASHIKANDFGSKFPLLMQHATRFDGMPPERLVWRLIERGLASGEVPRDATNDRLIQYAADVAENHYRGLRDALAGTAQPQPSPAPSTATPAQASAPATDPKAQPSGQGPRTITNASASVAPASPPATTTAPTEQPKPKYRSEKARREAILAQRLGHNS